MKGAIIYFVTVFGYSLAGFPPEFQSCIEKIANAQTVFGLECCNYNFSPFTNATMKKCDTEAEKGTMSKHFECIYDCVMTNDGIMNEAKQFNKDSWAKQVRNLVPSQWADVMADAPNDCRGFLENSNSPGLMCPTSKVDSLFMCITSNSILKCPNNFRKSSEICDNAMKQLATCMMPYKRS